MIIVSPRKNNASLSLIQCCWFGLQRLFSFDPCKALVSWHESVADPTEVHTHLYPMPTAGFHDMIDSSLALE